MENTLDKLTSGQATINVNIETMESWWTRKILKGEKMGHFNKDLYIAFCKAQQNRISKPN